MIDFSLFDNIPVGICVTDANLVAVFWNRCLERWTHRGRDVIVGTPLSGHFPSLKEPHFKVRLEDVFSGGAPAVFSPQLHGDIFSSPLPDGTYRIQRTTVTSIESPEGEESLALWAIEDVTDLARRIDDYWTLSEEAQKNNAELQVALSSVKTLKGLLPICASCKQVRDDSGYWEEIESYIGSHSDAEFSHSICPDCAARLYPDFDLGGTESD